MDNALQWQVQLLAQFAGHVFVSRSQGDTRDYLIQVALESSLAMMEMRARILELESQNKFLSTENQRLEIEVTRSDKSKEIVNVQHPMDLPSVHG